MSDTQRGTLHGISEGGLAGTHDLPHDSPVLVGPSTAEQSNKIIPGIIPIACWRVDDIRFKFDSSFVNPEIKAELQPAKPALPGPPLDLTSLIKENPGCPLSVFGHADPVGSDDYNKTLSGRRATAIYAMLIRDTNLWEELYSAPFGNDKWGKDALQIMFDEVSAKEEAQGQSESEQSADDSGAQPQGVTDGTETADSVEGDAGKRKALFGAYMDKLCGPSLKLNKTDFLARGEDAGGKGDYQGCGEFNPLLIFSQQDNDKFEQSQDKTKRNNANAPNRRVMVLLFRKGSRVIPSKWPCPRATEGVAGCVKRFWSDGQRRRSERLPDARKEYAKTHDTFACRFYDRLSNTSPCESYRTGDGLFLMQCFSGDGMMLLAKRKYRIRGAGGALQFSGVLDGQGLLRRERVPPGDYTLSVQGCSEDSPIAVLRLQDTVPQTRYLENGRLAISVLTPAGDAIPDATVQVSGLGERLTDEDGVAYFGSVPDREFSITVSKEGFTAESASGVQANSVAADSEAGAPAAPPGQATVNNAFTEATITLGAQKTPQVVRIDSRQIGTRSFRQSGKKLDDNTLTPSSSSNLDLDANKPVVLLRGSEQVFLTAVTNPPEGSVSVSWQVRANQSSGQVPDCNPKQGPQTQLSTDQVGSFSVAARLNGSIIFWNFVIVGVEVDTASTITPRDSGYVDLSQFKGGTYDLTKFTGVASGTFDFGKHAWSSEVKVNLTGGGPTGDLGCDQVEVAILQNVSQDLAVGVYQTKLALSDISFPELDTPGGAPDNYDGPLIKPIVVRKEGRVVVEKTTPFLHGDGMIKVGKAGPRAWVIQVGDSPATGFETRLASPSEDLQKIQGEEEFRTVVAAFSKQSKNAISVYGDAVWRANYTGDVSISHLVGEWSKGGAAGTKVVQPWKPILSSSGVHGTPAWNAQVEIFEPFALQEQDKPKRLIDKP